MGRSSLPRRAVISVGVASLLLGASLAASATQADPDRYPQAGCAVFTDPVGDALVIGAPMEPSVKSLDITAVSYRTSSSSFSTVLRVPGLAATPDRGTGETWLSTFKTGRHTVQIKVSRFSPVSQLNDVYNNVLPVEYLSIVSVDGKDTTAVLAGSEFDARAGFVTISVDRASLEVATKTPLGDLTTLSAQSDTRAVVSSDPVLGAFEFSVDTATAPKGLPVNATDNFCF